MRMPAPFFIDRHIMNRSRPYSHTALGDQPSDPVQRPVVSRRVQTEEAKWVRVPSCNVRGSTSPCGTQTDRTDHECWCPRYNHSHLQRLHHPPPCLPRFQMLQFENTGWRFHEWCVPCEFHSHGLARAVPRHEAATWPELADRSLAHQAPSSHRESLTLVMFLPAPIPWDRRSLAQASGTPRRFRPARPLCAHAISRHPEILRSQDSRGLRAYSCFQEESPRQLLGDPPATLRTEAPHPSQLPAN